jgi:hypothetical protein
VCVNTRDKSRVEEEDDDDDIMMTMICVPSIHPFSIHSLVSVQSKRKHKVLVNLAGWMDRTLRELNMRMQSQIEIQLMCKD